MKFEIEQSEVPRAQVGQQLMALGQALAATGDAVLRLDGDHPGVKVPDVPVTYEIEVKAEEGRGGKLEIELKWPAVSAQASEH